MWELADLRSGVLQGVTEFHVGDGQLLDLLTQLLDLLMQCDVLLTESADHPVKQLRVAANRCFG